MNTVKILNAHIDNLSKEELLQKLGQQGGVVFTPNVDHLINLQKDEEFYQIYQNSDYRVCDSQVLYYASRLLGQPIREKISGSDLFPAFYRHYGSCENTRIFLLGAGEGVAARAQQKINSIVGREIVVDTYSPPFGFEKDEVECQRIIDRVNHSGATVLAVGLGAPKQEKWIVKHKHKLKNIKVFLAIGASIDFEAGEKPRSPEWMSELGIEWFYRLSCEPKRLWKRYLVDDLPFVWLVIKQRLNLYRAPQFSLLPSATPTWQMPLLGQVLQEAGLITPHQVSMVLDAQAEQSNMRFGEILSHWGLVDQETVDFFAEHLPKISMESRKQPIGHYLKTAKLLNDQQIETILAEQHLTGMRFGETAVHKGWLKQETVDSILRYLAGDFSNVVAA
ncbi:WecB/TagA/CpsF family glycosyltransferase [Limnoraphis robusta Tam1]|uniref:WecB/TagA/CpsF family glycosyltransferase n=1 Tax=Limnoraphis robusta TaxID=1118279 RepID=UPI002B1F830E|nr:WecB/TagA/CpsF family glycosyltransferase [Limnoraphis robusta]MEA5497397.1 WecB/TagA/CpsF family glycosyltransferase [Limnoraphis robusta BA-68 BA1]MEA5539066.1 WecB/TagA/CpsF family glycosyltransferase [Limnoraphis robusta Tam1]